MCVIKHMYLSNGHLEGFENYKYSAKDTSPLSNYVMHPFWNSVVKICPASVAPNTLTFLGFLLTVANFILLSIYDPNYYASSEKPPGDKIAEIPRWVWIACAINHFVAHTLDGIDGKQARRTESSSPLGELFDHGLDAWTSFYIPACVWSIFGRLDYSISPFRFYLVLWNILFTFYVSHWEKYLTKVLFLPWGYDVSQIIIFVLYIVTWLYGTSFWKFTLFGLTTGNIFEILMYVGSLASALPMSFWNIHKSYSEGTGKGLNYWEAVRPLVNPFLFFTMLTLWAVESPSGILFLYPRIFIYTVGTLFANFTCRLIVSQMSNIRCELVNWVAFPLGFIILIAISYPSLEIGLLITLAVISTLSHIHYGVLVVWQMCQHFNIDCFRIVDKSE